jgi:hypothetical protein
MPREKTMQAPNRKLQNDFMIDYLNTKIQWDSFRKCSNAVVETQYALSYFPLKRVKKRTAILGERSRNMSVVQCHACTASTFVLICDYRIRVSISWKRELAARLTVKLLAWRHFLNSPIPRWPGWSCWVIRNSHQLAAIRPEQAARLDHQPLPLRGARRNSSGRPHAEADAQGVTETIPG